MKGKLIIIESGSDGSGKATQTELLFERLKKENYNVRKVSYPNYDSPACEPVKMYLNGEFGDKAGEVNAYAASTFYAVDRYASFKKDWEKFYNDGGIIIADRYTTSNMVHQASKMQGEEKEKYLKWLYELEFILYKLPIPNEVIFLDVHPGITLELIKDRNNKFTGEDIKDIHESDKEYLIHSYNNALYIANKYNWSKIECTKNNRMQSAKEIHELIYKRIIQIL